MKTFAMLSAAAAMIVTAGQAETVQSNLYPLIPGLFGYDTVDETARIGVSNFREAEDRTIVIEKGEFIAPEFVPELGVRWIADWGNSIGLFPVDAVYRGREAYRAWQETLSYGETCALSDAEQYLMPFLPKNETTTVCAFTRVQDIPNGVPAIVYCVFWRTEGISSPLECEYVAGIEEDQETVLAVRGERLPLRGGGGESFWYCQFPDTSVDTVSTKIKELMLLLTEGDGNTIVNNLGGRYVVGAEGINLRNYHDNFLVKLTIMGDITSANSSPSYADITASGDDVIFAYFRSFTVSPRFSSSIIDYREPSEIVEAEIYSRYSETVFEFYDENFPGYGCGLELR